MSFTTPPIPYTNLPDSYPIATVENRNVPYYSFGNNQIIPILSNLPLKLPARNIGGTFINETYTFEQPTGPTGNTLVYIDRLDGRDLAQYGPWVNGITGKNGPTGLAVGGCTGFNLITKTYGLINNTGSTGGQFIPNFGDTGIFIGGRSSTSAGNTGPQLPILGQLKNIVPYGQISINSNTIDFITNDIPRDSVYGKFPLSTNLNTAYNFPGSTGFTGILYPPPGWTGSIRQNSNFYDPNPNYPITQYITYNLPKNPTILSTPSTVGFGPIGFSLKNTAIFTCLSATALDAISIEALDANYQHVENTGKLHTHSAFAFINDQNGNWFIDTNIKVVGFMTDGFPLVAPYLVQDNSSSSGYRVINNNDLDECHGIQKKITFTINGSTLSYDYYYVGTLEFPYLISAVRGISTIPIDNDTNRDGERVRPPEIPEFVNLYNRQYLSFVINPNRFITITPNIPNWTNFRIFSINNLEPISFAGLISITSTGTITLNKLIEAGSYKIQVLADSPGSAPNPPLGTTRRFVIQFSVNQ
jgi:hypothetical protein